MAANNKYSIIGRYAQGREIVAFELANLSTNAHQRYTVNQVAYLVGRGSVLNCQGQIYNGKVLFRGVGCSLDQLPTVMEKPAEELNGAEAPIKNTENISGPARRNATNDQLMGQMTLVARVKVEETSKKTLGYDFKNVGGTTGTLWRGEVLKAAREGKVTNARVNSLNGKEILRSRGTTPEEQLSNLPIRIATPEELKKLGVKVETPAAKSSETNDNEKVADIFKNIISEVLYDSDARGLEYRTVDVDRKPIPMDKIKSIEFYTDGFSELSIGTFLVIRYKSKKNGCLAELSFDFNKNDTYNNKTSFVVRVAMLVKGVKDARPKNTGSFTFTLDAKTDVTEVYTHIMRNIVNGMKEADSSNEQKIIALSKAILDNLKVAADAELPNTDVHADSTEGENYAESTLKGYAKELESNLSGDITLKYVLNNTTMDSVTLKGKVNVFYNKENMFWLTLIDASGNEVYKTLRYEILGADEEKINNIAKTAIAELDFSQLAPKEDKTNNAEAFASLIAVGVNAIYSLRVPGLLDGTPVIRYSDTNGSRALTEGNGLEKGNFTGSFDISEDIINKACEMATNGADTVKVSVTTKYYSLDFIIKNNETFRIVYMDNSNRKPKLIATKEQTIMLDDVDTFEPVMTAAYQSVLQVLIELQPLMQAAVDSGEEFE